MKNPKDEDIIRLMREEWSKKVKALSEAVDLHLTAKVDGKEVEVMNKAQGLTVKSKKTGKNYTVIEAGPAFVKLSLVSSKDEKPEIIIVNNETLENDYVLDK